MNPQIVIPLLTGVSVVAIGGAMLVAYANRRGPLKARLEGIAASQAMEGTASVSAPQASPGIAAVIGSLGTLLSSGRSSKSLREQLTQAGYHHPDAPAIYLGIKILLLCVGLLAASIILLPSPMQHQNKLIIAGIFGLTFFLAPNAIISGRQTRRRREIRKNLPNAIDLLEVCASAGMGLDMAWNCVADEIRDVSQTLADEMALTNLEIHLGETRTNAMRHMAQRTGAEELSSMVAVLVQSERFGTSVSEALQTFAAYLRETSSQVAQEAAEKMAVKLIFPMVCFIFPSIVMIMAGPAFLTLYKSLKAH